MSGITNGISFDRYADIIQGLRPYLKDTPALQAVLPLLDKIAELEKQNSMVKDLEKRYIEKCQEVIRLADQIKEMQKSRK